MEVANTSLRNVFPPRSIGGTTEDHPITNIARHLPHIARVGFADIDHVKGRSVPVLLIQPIERGNLPAKWRSSIAAEDQYDRLRAPERREPDCARMIQQRQLEVRSRIARLQSACAGLEPHRFKRKNNERHRTHMRHYPRELIRRLAHRVRKKAVCSGVGNCQHSRPNAKPLPEFPWLSYGSIVGCARDRHLQIEN